MGAALAGLVVACGQADVDDDEELSETESELTASDKTAFDFFVSKGLTAVQAAGIVGNLDQESGMNPKIKQFGGGPGRGIAQWSAGGRWDSSKNDNAVAFAKGKGIDVYALKTQLEFVWYELTTFPGYGLESLKDAKDVTTSVRVFMKKFEVCGACADAKRISFAKAALAAYGSKPPPPPPPPVADAGTGKDASTKDAGPASDAGTTVPGTTVPTEEPAEDEVDGGREPETEEEEDPVPVRSGRRLSSQDSVASTGCSTTPTVPGGSGMGLGGVLFAAGLLLRRSRRTTSRA